MTSEASIVDMLGRGAYALGREYEQITSRTHEVLTFAGVKLVNAEYAELAPFAAVLVTCADKFARRLRQGVSSDITITNFKDQTVDLDSCRIYRFQKPVQ